MRFTVNNITLEGLKKNFDNLLDTLNDDLCPFTLCIECYKVVHDEGYVEGDWHSCGKCHKNICKHCYHSALHDDHDDDNDIVLCSSCYYGKE